MTFLLAALFLGQAPTQGQTPPPAGTTPKVQAPPSPPIAQVPNVSLDPPALPAADAVVLTVNGHGFTAKELEPYLWDRFAAKIGDEFVNYELIKEEAAKQGIVVTDAEVTQKIRQGLQQFVAQPSNAKDPIKQLRDRDFPPSRIVMATKTQLMLEKLVDKEFKPDDYVRLAWIVIRPKTQQSPDDLKKAIAAGDAAYADLKAGTTWDKVVAKYSDQQAAANGGDLNWLPLASLPVDIRTEIAGLAPNGYTKPFNIAQIGIQIVKLEARGKDASPPEMASLKARVSNEVAAALIKKLKDQAKITPAY